MCKGGGDRRREGPTSICMESDFSYDDEVVGTQATFRLSIYRYDVIEIRFPRVDKLPYLGSWLWVTFHWRTADVWNMCSGYRGESWLFLYIRESLGIIQNRPVGSWTGIYRVKSCSNYSTTVIFYTPFLSV